MLGELQSMESLSETRLNDSTADILSSGFISDTARLAAFLQGHLYSRVDFAQGLWAKGSMGVEV